MKEHFLTILRNRKTDTLSFRAAADSLSYLIAAEIGAVLPLQPTHVETPLGKSPGARLERRVILISILRSGMVLLPPFQKLLPSSPLGFFGIRRDEKDAHPILYYEKIPSLLPSDQILLLDPMLATGGSAMSAIQHLEKKKADLSKLTLVTLIASQPGIQAVKKSYPAVSIYSVAIDKALDQNWFIVPGLGDFGDRYFGTE